MKRARIFLVIALLLAVLFVTGCGRRDAELEPVVHDDFISDTETPYRLYDGYGDEFVYLREDHPEVIGVRELVEEFVTVMNTMDYRSIETDKAHRFLSESLLEVTLEQQTWEILADSLREVEVISEAKSVEIETAFFEEDATEVYILYTSTLTILEANEEKLAETSMALGDNSERAGLYLLKLDGQWKVNGFGKLD